MSNIFFFVFLLTTGSSLSALLTVAMEMFKATTGAKLNHVPYRGATQAAVDVQAGHVPVMFSAAQKALAKGSGLPPKKPATGVNFTSAGCRVRQSRTSGSNCAQCGQV